MWLEGELVLIEDGGETLIEGRRCRWLSRPCRNGHHLVKNPVATRFISKSARAPRASAAHYPDDDLAL